jgi:hypothetical protein
MSWINIGDFLWFIGALLAAGVCVYGGWFSIMSLDGNRNNVTGEARSSGAAPGPRLRAPRRRAMARAQHLGARRAYKDIGVKGA